MFANIKNRIQTNKKGAALVLTFALVITGSGLSSLASLQDTLNDTVTFNTLSVDLKDGTADSSSVTFSAIDPSTSADFEQNLNLTNSGSASATISIDTIIGAGAGSDLDAAITTAVMDGTCAAGGPRIDGGSGMWPSISTLGDVMPNFALNAGQAKAVCIHWHFNANPTLTTTDLTATYKWTATHP